MAKPTQVNTDFIPMATGAKGSSPRSAGNVMPGPSALGGSRGGIGGGGSGLGANPSRTGAPPSAAGSYMNQPGSPPQGANQVTPGSVPASSLGGASKAALTHGRTLGAIAHLRSIGADHPHLATHHAKATSALAGMKKNSAMKKQGLPGGPSFGSLGGTSGTGNGNSLIPSAGAGNGQPLGMARLPDEM